jgi:peptide/nickel transport system permease protein
MTALNPRDAVVPAPGRGFSALSERQNRVLVLVAKRLIQIPAVLLVVSILTFWLIQVVPGDPGREVLGQYATAAQVHQWDVQNGVTGSTLHHYLHWLGGFLTGSWGSSYTYSEPARGLVLGHLVNSMLLGGVAFVLLIPFALAFGAIQAYREGRRTDRAVTISLMTISAVPVFTIGAVLMLVFCVWLKIAPVQVGATGSFFYRVREVLIPAIALALSYLAVVARMVRTGALGPLMSPYYRTAVLKGVPPGQIVRRHVLRNALVPTLPLLGLYLGAFLCGDAVVETLFSYPGLGALLVEAAQHKDVLVLTDGVMVTGVVALLALLAADVGLILADPRIRFDNRQN